MTGISITLIIGLIVIFGALFMSCNPQFGKHATKKQIEEYAKLEYFKNGKFINLNPSPMDINYWKMIKEWTKNAPNRNPSNDIIVEKIDSTTIENHNADITQLTWFGHSTFLLEIDGKKILIDPMLSKTLSPISFLGAKRYSNNIPIEAENLPFIDAVILSHDHYDHLDYKTIKQIKNKVGEFYAPLGVGNHLKSWGVNEENITELNWWESVEFDSISFVCTPARHFSGRGLFDRASTLWCSWVIKGSKDNIYFSGDSGYDTHFKKIGEKYGPFDISLLECGQYNEDWKLLHMMPEETALAAIDLKSKLAMPIHWGAFTIALHDWNEPVERMLKKANELNLSVTTPKIGESVILGKDTFPTEKWWKNYIFENKN
ncbi:MAG: MBL fold metallo-hydrolase [Candidatus Marinimicrobia bacterium]|nr:MBL fold metallo-hydrolase [Candidatus Neomarinimicrobiota bacterium]